MIGRISSWLKRRTRGVIAAASKPLLQRYLQRTYIERYGELMDLHIDSGRKRILMTVTPLGEKMPIEITADYKLRDRPDGLSLTITKVHTSKEWLTLLAEDYFVPRDFPVHRVAKAIL